MKPLGRKDPVAGKNKAASVTFPAQRAAHQISATP